jgi:hypothetical protein
LAIVEGSNLDFFLIFLHEDENAREVLDENERYCAYVGASFDVRSWVVLEK